MCGFSISKGTNLKCFAIRGTLLDTSQRELFIHVLFALNAPRLQHVILAFEHDNRFMNVKDIDDCLGVRFKNLELLTVECVGLQEVQLECACREIRKMFPQMARRGMLRVLSVTESFHSCPVREIYPVSSRKLGTYIYVFHRVNFIL